MYSHHPPPRSAWPCLSSSPLKVKGHQVFRSILCGNVRGQCYAPQWDNKTHTHKLQPDWVVTLLWGGLIVFRWGNLRRGSGKEDRSRELKDQRRKAEGNKLAMCRIFSFRSGFWWETCRHFISFFLSLGNPQLGHTHYRPKYTVLHFLKCPVVHLVKFQWYPPLRATQQNKPLNELQVMVTAGQALQQYHYHTHAHTQSHCLASAY